MNMPGKAERVDVALAIAGALLVACSINFAVLWRLL
jgi:hypothetical protein